MDADNQQERPGGIASYYITVKKGRFNCDFEISILNECRW